jgi:hypothetical protein
LLSALFRTVRLGYDCQRPIQIKRSFDEPDSAAINIDEQHMKRDAERFKEFVESRGRETGSWRGDVAAG